MDESIRLVLLIAVMLGGYFVLAWSLLKLGDNLSSRVKSSQFMGTHVLGAFAGLIGLAIAWMAYDSDHPKKHLHYLLPLMFMVFVYTPQVLAVIWRRLVGSPASDKYFAQVQEKLPNPDWDFYQEHLQRPVPPGMKRLFADTALLASGNIDLRPHSIDTEINYFLPIAREFLLEPGESFPAILPFATNAYGDPTYLLPGPAQSDAVYVTFHDGGDTEVVSNSVDDFADAILAEYSAVQSCLKS